MKPYMLSYFSGIIGTISNLKSVKSKDLSISSRARFSVQDKNCPGAIFVLHGILMGFPPYPLIRVERGWFISFTAWQGHGKETTMRRYQKKNIVRKDRNVTIRFDQDTYNRIEATARAADLSVSEYIRRMVIKGKVTVRQEIVAEVPMLKKLIAEFGKIGSNLNQIARHYNGGGVRSTEMYNRTQRAISELYAMKYEVERMGGEFRDYSEAYRKKKK